LEGAGVGVRAEGCSDVSLRNLAVRGFATGLMVTDAKAWCIENCDFSNNYHNPGHGWGELPARGGILLTRVNDSVLRKNRANNDWDGLHLINAHDNLITDNDFSHCCNACAKLWTSCRNRFLHNNLSYGLRIDRAKDLMRHKLAECFCDFRSTVRAAGEQRPGGAGPGARGWL
jgi:parallel beta-helix repeat protein